MPEFPYCKRYFLRDGCVVEVHGIVRDDFHRLLTEIEKLLDFKIVMETGHFKTEKQDAK